MADSKIKVSVHLTAELEEYINKIEKKIEELLNKINNVSANCTCGALQQDCEEELPNG